MNSDLSCSRLQINAPSIVRLRQRLLSSREPFEPADCFFWSFLWVSSLAACPLTFRRGAVDKVDSNRSFSYSRGHTLHIPRTSIAHRKNAGTARFQHLWRTSQRPRGSIG